MRREWLRDFHSVESSYLRPLRNANLPGLEIVYRFIRVHVFAFLVIPFSFLPRAKDVLYFLDVMISNSNTLSTTGESNDERHRRMAISLQLRYPQ